ncbi:hypothetical protein ACHAXS_000461, partial [Conticribra weissflogii]
SKKDIVFIAIYKDNILPVVNELAINKTFKILQQEVLNLEIKIASCIWLRQLHLMTYLNKRFGKLIEKLQWHKLPGALGYGESRPTKKTRKLFVRAISVSIGHRNAILFICNSTKDLMVQLYLHIMKCCTIYILYKNYRLKFDPIDKKNKPWDLVCYSDSDYVGYNDTR